LRARSVETGRSLTYVPFLLPTSVIVKSSPFRRTTQWRRDSRSSEMWRPLVASRPTVRSSVSMGTVEPSRGPDITMKPGRFAGIVPAVTPSVKWKPSIGPASLPPGSRRSLSEWVGETHQSDRGRVATVRYEPHRNKARTRAIRCAERTWTTSCLLRRDGRGAWHPPCLVWEVERAERQQETRCIRGEGEQP